MRAAVITTPQRSQYRDALLAVLQPQVESVRLFVDEERRGNTWNLSRCMREMLDGAKADEPILITCDDVITVPDFRRRWERIHAEARNTVYTFMSRQRFLFKEANLRRGWVTKAQARGFYDHAVIYLNQHGLMDRIEAWFRSTGRYVIPPARAKHLDVIIQDYFIDQNLPWTLSTPTLFDHVGTVSNLGHNIGGSPCYVGAK